MHTSTKKWLFIKASSFILIPFILWFIINFVSIIDNNYYEVVNFFKSQPSKVLFSVFLVFFFFFYSLTISEIFEDYIHNEKIKNVANRILYMFAIIIPMITIISLYKL